MPTEPHPEGGGNAQQELLQRTLAQLPEPATQLLETLAFPHWFEDTILARLIAQGEFDRDLAALAINSTGWGLIERWSDGALAVVAPVRTLLLNGAAANAQDYRRRSLLFAEAFDSLSREGGDVFDRAESVYHRLAAEPDRGTELMLADGITWKSEPVFAFDALERLVSGAREQQQRRFLPKRAAQYLELLALYLPHSGKTARDEEQILRHLMKYETGVNLYEAELRLRLGLAVLSLGNTAEARTLLEIAKELFNQAEITRGAADALRSLGRTALRADRLEEALDFFTEARAIFDRLGLAVSSAHCIKALAETEFYRGRSNDAEPLFELALADFASAAGYLGAANTRVVYAQFLSARSDFARAYKHIDLAIETYSAIGHRLGIANCLKNRAVVLFDEGSYETALSVLTSAFDLYEEWGSASGRANCWLWSAACETRLGRPDRALPLLDKASATFVHIGERFGQALVFREQGLAELAAGRPQDALKPLRQAHVEFLAVGNCAEAKVTAVALGVAAVVAEFPPPFTRPGLHAMAEDAARTFAALGLPRRLLEAEALMDATREVAGET